MQANDTRTLTVFKMTPNSIANLFVKALDRIGLSEDRRTKRARSQPALGGILNNKDQFVHGVCHDSLKNIAE